MPCTSLASKVANACLSGIWKLRDPVLLKQAIAQNLCEAVIGGTAWFTSFTFSLTANNFTGAVGCRFTVGANPITVRQLGSYVIPGSTRVHTLRLHTLDCVTLLASATMDFTGKSGLSYVSVTPVVLAAGSQYKVSCSVVNTEDFFVDTNGSNAATTSAATIGASMLGAALNCPNTDAGVAATVDYAGATFKYTL